MVKDDQSLSDPKGDTADTVSAESIRILSDPDSWQSAEDRKPAAKSGADDNFKLRDGSRSSD